MPPAPVLRRRPGCPWWLVILLVALALVSGWLFGAWLNGRLQHDRSGTVPGTENETGGSASWAWWLYMAMLVVKPLLSAVAKGVVLPAIIAFLVICLPQLVYFNKRRAWFGV